MLMCGYFRKFKSRLGRTDTEEILISYNAVSPFPIEHILQQKML